MSTNISPSGASSKLSFEFVGSTANISSLTPVSLSDAPIIEPTPVEPTPVEPQPVTPPAPIIQDVPSTSTPDTGFFTGDNGIDPAPLFIFGAVFAALVTVAIIIYRRRPRIHRDYTIYSRDRLCIRDIRTSGRHLAVSLSIVFSLFLAVGIALPQLIAPSTDLESNAIEGYISVSVSTDTLSPSARLGSRISLALASQTITATTSQFDLYVNVAEDATNGNYLFLDGDTTKGYIAPTSGTLMSKRPLSANEWGFTLSGIATARNNSSIWAAVPLYGSTTPSNKIHSSSDTTSSVTITYGAAGLASSTPNGSHQQTIVYTAVSGI